MKIQSLLDAWRQLKFKELRVQASRCPICGPTLLILLQGSEQGVRCLRCRGTITALSLIKALRHCVADLGDKHVYELSARGYVVRYLKKHAAALTCSEYLPDLSPGSHTADGIRCEDVQALTFADESFDVCTSCEVFEHVPDDLRGFREIQRTLKSDGVFVFTVPLHDLEHTRERARLIGGRVEHLLPPEYHDDLLTGRGSVLSFRDYGRDIIERLRTAGFARAAILPPHPTEWWGYQRPVIVAAKSLSGPSLTP